MKDVTVAFVWHFHQPYYSDPLTHTGPFPWVRLHAAKGYFDMGVLLEEHPDMRATVNLTPSLLLQIQEQVRGTVTYVFWTHAARPAADLNEDEQAFVLRHFFAANWDTMVRPHDRYYTLLIQRGTESQESELARLARRFSVQDFLDLQVWHNLAWFGHRAVARYPALRELIAKGRQFTETDKQEVLKIQHEVLSALIPLFRRLHERGQIELSTTPFFHPILPLLIDSDIAKRSRPDSVLPARFIHPEDARAQLRLALEFHETLFGHRPVGIWPSEGSVCPELVPMLAELGVRWTATDEGILAGSLDAWRREEQLYRPYSFSSQQGEVAFLFRDRELSDAIGFTYSRNEPAAAVTDFCGRLRGIGERSADPRPLVPVILDGENPWEHYADGGEGFLRGLYEAMGQQDGEIRLRSSIPKDCLEESRPKTRLSRLHSGSWINADLRIWIGHPEDNDAWDRVAKTRRVLQREQQEGRHAADTLKAAWNELYAAEGSDWYWWYGDEFETDHKAIFDQVFRSHLANVYRLLGADVPEFLKNPVWRRVGTEVTIREPVALISPCIDGIVSDFYEWRGAGYMDGRAPLSAMYKGPPVFSRVYFGFNFDQFYLRLDPAEESRDSESSDADSHRHSTETEVHVQFLEPRPAELVFALNQPDPPQFTLHGSVDGINVLPVRAYDTIRRKKIIELAVPLKDLSVELGSEIQLVIKVMAGGLERERLPQHQPLVLKVPDHTFEATMWKA